MTRDESDADGLRERNVPFVFGVSGHRDLVTDDLPELRDRVDTVFERFCEAYPGYRFELLSPLAEGADRLAAEIALARDIALRVPMPMPQGEYEKDFAAAESLQDFRRLLAAAKNVWQVETEKGTGRDDQYAAVGEYIAKTSHVLILLWDGRLNKKKGGTGWVKLRRDYWTVNAEAKPGPPGYLETIQIVTPRQTSAKRGETKPRIEIVGKLPG